MRMATVLQKERCTTLVDVLRERAARQPHRLAFAFDRDDGAPPVEHTYAELDRRARAIAALLQQRGLAGERALLVYPPGLDFVAAFYGCLYAGTVAVPAHPPRRQTMDRLTALALDARPAIVLCTSSIAAAHDPSADAVAGLPDLDWMSTEDIDDELAGEWSDPRLGPDSLAFLQYTSGSTTAPRGVAVSHGNIVHNSAVIERCFGHTEDSVGMCWLPAQHDMGLVGGVMQPVFAGVRILLMSPLTFLQRPLRWLDAMSQWRATTGGAPNFAYELCIRKVTPQHLATLDLSSWDLAFTGAEPVRSTTLAAFAATFAPCGFRPEAFYPCYGLAEGTLLVTGGHKAERPRSESVRSSTLEDGWALAAEPASRDTRTLVSCGHPWLGTRVAIVDADTGLVCPERRVGEIWITGDSVAQGYWGRPEESGRVFRARLAGGEDPWLRTGDLGYLSDGELYFVGRLKDLIIIDGRNHYPEDIEQVVEASHERLRPHGCCAFSVEQADTERLIVVAEVQMQLGAASPDLDGVIRTIRGVVAGGPGIPVHAVVLVRGGSLPRTTSGKIRRAACRRDYLAGTLKTLWSSERAPGR